MKKRPHQKTKGLRLSINWSHKNRQLGAENNRDAPSRTIKKMGRRQFLLSSFLTLGSVIIGQTSHARGRFCRPIKIGHPYPEDSVEDNWAKDFKKRLFDLDKKIEVENHSNVPLPKLISSILSQSNSLFDLVFISAPLVASLIPEWRALSLPALYPNFEVVKRLNFESPFFRKISHYLEAKKGFLVTLGWNFNGIATTGEGIRSFQDLKGKKIQVWTDDWKNLFAMAGSSPTIMPGPEVVQALKMGSLNGTIASYRMLKPLKGVIKSLTWSPNYSVFSSAVALICSSWFWNKTGNDLQAKLLQIGNESAVYFQNEYDQKNLKAIDAARKEGINIIDLEKKEFQKWAAFSKKSSWEKFAQDVEGGKEIISLALGAQKM